MAQFVAALREQIRSAQADADPNLQFELGPISVEFTLLSRREGEGKAGVRFWVVGAGVSGRLANESTQKVTMQLTPRGPGGVPPALIRDVEPGRGRRDVERGHGGGHGDIEPR